MHVPREALTLTKGSPASRQRKADSGNLLTITFCGVCGSALYAANSGRPRTRTIYVGTLDQAAAVEVNAHIWTKRRLPWVLFPEGHRIFREAGDWRPDYASEPSRFEL